MAAFLRIVLLTFPDLVWGYPIGGQVDSSADAWATALSDIGPLILLVGERSTKQLLRDVRGFSTAFSLATAPLGLVSIVTSLLRLRGSHRLRSFLGYEFESRSVAALEMSQVNCNGVHAQLIDGYIVRSTAATSVFNAGAMGISTLKGTLEEHAVEVIAQLQSCHEYGKSKDSLHIPEADAKLHWCCHATIEAVDESTSNKIVSILITALEIRISEKGIDLLQEDLQEDLSKAAQQIQKRPSKRTPAAETDGAEPIAGGTDHPDAAPAVLVASNPVANKGTISFLCTFEAISEFCTAKHAPLRISFVIGLVAGAAILALFIVELWLVLRWKPSPGWILAFLGYLGVVTSVVGSAIYIARASQPVFLTTRTAIRPDCWRDGLVVAAQSDGKGGADVLCTASKAPQKFEAMWLKPSTQRSRFMADFISISLTLSFLCHYLGIRSSRWWFGAGELAVCILAALFRSLTKNRPEKFSRDSDPDTDKLDWKCCTTGVIRVKEPQKLDSGNNTRFGGLDVRVYSEAEDLNPPAAAENIAWQLASLCLADSKLGDWLLDITGMRVHVYRTGQENVGKRAVIVSFHSGLLTKEGIASPNTLVQIAFRSSAANLAAPTGLLARGIMRQPFWMVNEGLFANLIAVVGNVHIPALNPVVSWWTVSEMRNGLKDNQENLQWAFMLLNALFFVLLRRDFADDQVLICALSAMHQDDRPDSKELAMKLCGYFRKEYDEVMS